MLWLDDDVCTAALARVPFASHGSVRATCKRLSRLVASQAFAKERRAWGLERALVFAGGRLNHDDVRKSKLAWSHLAGSWRAVASMPEGRAASAFAAMGRDVVVAGGLTRGDPWNRNAEAITNEVLAFRVVENSWRRLAPLGERRFSAQGAYFEGVGFVVAGGTCDGISVTDRVEAYDADADAWALLEPMPVAAMTAACGVVRGGLVVAGGCADMDLALDSCQVFDAATRRWRLGPPMPAQVDDAAYAVFRDCLYVVGGIDVNGDRLDTVFIFDGAQWTTGPKLPYAISCATAAVHDGTIILFHHHQQGDTDRKFARRRIELRGGTWVLRDETTRPALTDQLHLPIICANVLLG